MFRLLGCTFIQYKSDLSGQNDFILRSLARDFSPMSLSTMKIMFLRNRINSFLNLLEGSESMRKARMAVLTRTFLFVFMISFASGQDSPSPKRIEVKSPSSNGNIASLQSYAFSFDSDATPVNANNVEDLKNVSVQVVTAGRPVLVAILPENTNMGSRELIR